MVWRALLIALVLIATQSPSVLRGQDTPAATDPIPSFTPEQLDFFEKQVRPVLVNRCYECHGAKKQEMGLRLDSRSAALKGADDGAVAIPSKPNESRLIAAVRYDGDIQMPPKEKLPQPEIDALTAWVEMGMPWPAEVAPVDTGDPAAQAASHWAFQPIQPHAVPAVQRADWPKTPIDTFILAKLEAAGLTPFTPIDRVRLLRRLSFDLIGLPPSPEEVDAFVNDAAPDAFEKVVDRLLASPHYGERWGRHWLDIARYADTKGYVFEEDRNYPNAFKYRDWVVKALNEDLPYDQFLTQQIAADRLPAEANPNLAAMGFLTVGRRFLNNKHDIIDDRLDVLTRGTLALTVTCARCHDHKFDPIPTADYYSLYGVFASSVETKDSDVMRLEDVPDPRPARIFVRGNPGNDGPEVPRQFLNVLSRGERKPFEQGSGRLELAQKITSRDNPLTARVMVNRVWGHHFGQGLVRSPSNFGLRGDPPSHPELLDYLAQSFMDEGWSLKKLHRKVLLSAVYQQSSDDRPECREKDPENLLLWRMNRQRLSFESLRDSLLAVTGSIDLTIGGPAVELGTEPFSRRRTIYGKIDRQNLPGMFRTFDFASPDTHSPQRYITTVPQQALFLMNGPLAAEQAQLLVKRPDVAAITDNMARVDRMYRLLFGRSPSDAERQWSLEFIAAEDQRTATATAGQSPVASSWEKFAQALLMTNEFMFVD